MSKNNCFANLSPCSGCGACYAVCPAAAISYTLNANGFYEAQVVESKCISCGKCVAVCPKYVQDKNQLDKNTFPVYSFIHKDPQILAESSSGAAAWALTKMAFKQGYQVAGVAYDYKTNTANTVLAEELSQAQSFKGSKYIQANTQIYKDLLRQAGKFLVFGTPCQLAGLAQAAKQQNRRDDFLLVDCFCHGVPSYWVWQNFLKHIGIENPQKVSFRSKKGGWHNYYMYVEGEKTTYQADARTNPFYQLFFSDLLLNDACYTCRAKSAAYADIRLGDFWGGDYDLTEKGISLVLPLSARGKEWTEELASVGSLQDIGHLRHKIVKSQSAFTQTLCHNQRRTQLLAALAQKPFAQAFGVYQQGCSKKKLWGTKLKAHLPVSMAKYVRFVVHKIKGY